MLTCLDADTLRACSKVSVLFKELSGPLFLDAIGFKPCPFWLTVDETDLEGLLVWRCLQSYVVPQDLFFHASNDSHLRALDIFLRTPRVANGHCLFLSCSASTISPSLVKTVLKSMVAAGCRHMSYTHTSSPPPTSSSVRFLKILDSPPSDLDKFWVESRLAFSRNIISFTVGVLRSSPLTDLSLWNTGLGHSMWVKLLSLLTFPHLAHLELDCMCPIKTTLDFVRRHPSLCRLQLHGCTNTTQNHVKWHPSINLPSLNHLGGPPGYVSAVARHHQNCAVVRSLGVTFTDIHSASPLIPQLLDITRYFSNLLHLQVLFQLSTAHIMEEVFGFPVLERHVIHSQTLKSQMVVLLEKLMSIPW